MALIFARTHYAMGGYYNYVAIIRQHLFNNSNYTFLKIENALESNDDLKVHFKSKDTDIGENYLKPHESFESHFRPNVWGCTLFYCWYSWKGGCYWFEIYSDTRDNARHCVEVCAWQIKKKGPCLYIPKDKKSRCYDWNAKPGPL
ncbi:S-protein homolog 3-like [Arachis duranensis]|uniref:S-protein homolog n=1 Tax=Arachis duranensis TaxID=130453 RepID=A0A6P4D5Q0_ARADU|nr:S-protein homolog 3-like [Arachis duranensis]XP_025692985.1 S-protein homolog 3-like [Arachis hypogaea]